MDKQFKAGEVVIKEGTVDHAAYIIRQGRVGVYLGQGKSRILINQLGVGEIFGEMGLVDDKPRSATIIAVDDLTVHEIDRNGFNELLRSDPEVIIPVLKALFERLREANQTRLDMVPGAPPPPAPTASAPLAHHVAPRLTLRGVSAPAREALHGKDLLVDKFPFRIGRATHHQQADALSCNDLYLHDREPYNVSRNHLAFILEQDTLMVQDRGSAMGTIVGRDRLGGDRKIARVPLAPGDHALTIGLASSPYQFSVHV